MKIDKAIETLQYHAERNAVIAGSTWVNALKLGIEALKRCKELESPSNFSPMRPLPGETKD